MPCSAPVDVTWADQNGRSRHAKAQLVEVSSGGLSFLLKEKIPVKTPVRIQYSCGNVDGETRYWTFDILGWVVGVQLDQRVNWDPLLGESKRSEAAELPRGLSRPRRRFSDLLRRLFPRLAR